VYCIRFALHSAKQLGLRAIVPCYQGLSCATFSISRSSAGIRSASATASASADATASDPDDLEYIRSLAVVAGHFSWGIWSQLPSYVGHRLNNAASSVTARNSDPDAVMAQAVSVDGTSSSPPAIEYNNTIPSCFVVGRDPIDRIVSYYYQRCFETPECPGFGRYLNELSVEEFLHLARTYYQVSSYEYEQQQQQQQDTGQQDTGENAGGANTGGATNTESVLSEKQKRHTSSIGSYSVVLDDGISNAACRSLSGETSLRGYLNVNTTSGEEIDPWPPAPLEPLSPHAQEVALQNIEHCVVALAETWSATAERIVRHWFPWMVFQDYTIFRTTTLMGDGTEKEKARYIRPELRQAILSVNECDVKLYEKMKQLHDAQMEVLNANAFVF
jgi:hypothetical protein